MTTETELKLRITPEDMGRLKRHALLKTHQVAKPVTRHLHNIYFDTPELDLNRREMALRLRLAGGRWLQTLKGGGSIRGGLHQRNEWEVPVASDQLDFSVFEAAVCDEFLPLPLRDRLEAVFATDFQRSSQILEWQGAQIEVCMDHGEVRAGTDSAPICEVELELKSGTPLQLFELALAILEIVPFELESVSKAERGFRLMAGYVEQPAKAELPKFPKKAALTQVLGGSIWACLAHFQQNIHGAMTGCDPEYLHQMRVALRRLRLLLGMAEKLRPDQRLTALRVELSEWAGALGKARDWDVFIGALTRHPLYHQPDSDNQAMQALLTCCRRQREACYQSLQRDQQQRAAQRLMLHFAIWMNGEYWQQPEDGVRSAHEFSARQLSRLLKRYKQAERHLGKDDADGLHALRILARKLRYSADFFAPLHKGRRKKPFIGALGEVQEVLGKIHDATVASHLLKELAAAPELAGYPEIITLVREWVAIRRLKQFGKLDRACHHLARLDEFWLK
ncbi:MAG: CHAD domain-containing protein [Gallionella sp.]|nr:CHAD domain-containing protein [Gallionella sp.]MDD4946493.1 CHAD domain-containing protein [Gallionella sp.]